MPSCVSANPVSIPVWFDWEHAADAYLHCAHTVSIPVWFDWEEGGEIET